MFEIDKRTKEDIVRQIRDLAESYVPEWRFDEENPDIGTALGLVYAGLFSKTIRQFNKVPMKNRIAFFNCIDAKLLPAMPSSGYVTFGMVNANVEGVKVAAGTMVMAESKEKGVGNVTFETIDDMYATPARVNHIFQVADSHDYISHTYKDGDEKAAFCFFDWKEENLQEHMLCFCHEDALRIKKGAWITLNWFVRDQRLLSEELEKAFLDDEVACFEYYTEDGFIPFFEKRAENGMLLLRKGEGQPEFAKTRMEKTDSYWIRCKIKDIRPFLNFSFENFTIGTKGMEIKPELISGAGLECDQNEYFPFGEKMGIYTEAYFASEEVLCKKGALIHFGFHMDFVRIPLEFNEEPKEIEWNWVMKRSEFQMDPEYDVTIGEVLWEYYNGNGWSRLFPDKSYADVFSTERGTVNQYRSLTFVCPHDIKPVLIHSCESYYIRVRIIKMNNAYKTRGNYVTPLLGETTFGYEYQKEGVIPEHICVKNNLESFFVKGRELMCSQQAVMPFFQTGEDRPMVYLGFHVAPVGGPLKMLVMISGTRSDKPPALRFEFFSIRKWKELRVVDETENLCKTGLITFWGQDDFTKGKRFGEELYWIRIVDERNHYVQDSGVKSQAWITGIHMNTVKVLSVKSNNPEFFTSTHNYAMSKALSLKLLHASIYDIDVWINEAEELSVSEIAEIEKEGVIETTYHDIGELKEAWVKWSEVRDFDFSAPTDRHYIVDKNEGIVIFGDGGCVHIPLTKGGRNIKVQYRSGGGENSNVNAGEINTLGKSIGFINSVTNTEYTSGGCDMEIVSDSIHRHAAALKHRDRAMSARDFEELSMAASRGIKRADCFSGYNERGEKASGFVTLVVLQKDYVKGQNYFQAVREEIYSYLKDRMDPNLIKYNRFHVVQPIFIEICVRIEVVVKSFHQVFQVKSQIQEKLKRFLNPNTGNFDRSGWETGQFPNIVQIQNAVYDGKGIALVKHVSMLVYRYEESKRMETDMEEVKSNRFVLPMNGEHEVLISVE